MESLKTGGIRLLVADFNAVRAPQQEPYRLLAKAGFEVLLLVPQRWREAFGTAEAEAGPVLKNLTVLPLPVRFNGKYHRVLFKGLERALRDFQPDEIWLHAEPENFLAYQGLRARDRHCPRAGLSLVSWRNIPYARGGLPYKAAWLYQAIEDRLRGAGARLLCYNRDAERIMGRLGFEVTPTRMGVNLDYFSPGSQAAARRSLALPVKGKIAGFAGRFIEEKGVADLITAAATIAGLRLLLIGDGPAKQAWVDQAAAAGVAMDIRALKHEGMAQAFRAMDVACLPSRSTAAWKEQFGRVLIEAMACGTPVLGSDSGEIGHVIAKAGLVVPESDAPALAAALRRLLKKPPRAAALRRAGEFEWKAVAQVLARDFSRQPHRLNQVAVQGVGVFGGSRSELLEAFEALLRSRQGGLLYYLNAHLANLAASDPDFRGLLRQADLVLPDGAGVLLSARLNGKRLPQRLALGDLLLPLAQRAAQAKVRIFLWGSEKGVAEAAARALPGKTAGCADGFQSEDEWPQVIGRIRASRAKLVFLGLGSPKQERLALRLRQELPGVTVVVCGNAFVFVAGLQRRAPAWMQALSLEWAWRLMLEPGRLGRRYVLGNLSFIFRALWERCGGRP